MTVLQCDISLVSIAELIAYISNGIDKSIIAILDLFSQSSNIHINGPIPTVKIMTPNFIKKSITAENSFLISRQKFE